jgi:hypothetical protein
MKTRFLLATLCILTAVAAIPAADAMIVQRTNDAWGCSGAGAAAQCHLPLRTCTSGGCWEGDLP